MGLVADERSIAAGHVLENRPHQRAYCASEEPEVDKAEGRRNRRFDPVVPVSPASGDGAGCIAASSMVTGGRNRGQPSAARAPVISIVRSEPATM